MDNQIKEIASIIHKYNKRADIKVDGYKASHLPISFGACFSYAKNIQLAFKFYKDGSKFGLMDVDKTLTDLRKIKGQIKNSIDLIDNLPLAVKLPSNHFDMMKKLGLDSENSKPVLENFKENLVNFDNVYVLLAEYVKKENFKKSKINKQVLAVVKESAVIWRAVAQASGPTFDRLNPSGKRVKSNPNALALIIGVADYAKTPANALYADKDAQQFYDYATMKLGIPSSNIKELVNDKADLGEILINVKDWLRRSAKPNKSDIYIYFAGHGLASQDGSKMYLLPYDGRPRLLENTALLRDELFKDIKQANPRSVTVFLDTCYSGVTRNEEMLIAGRPIVIKAKEQAIPDGFTLFSAASNEQISCPLEEAKHGMFSYFLMKGMEGDADANNDNKITARKLHAYVEQNVVQQSSCSQTPELQGDKDRVLVQFN